MKLLELFLIFFAAKVEAIHDEEAHERCVLTVCAVHVLCCQGGPKRDIRVLYVLVLFIFHSIL